MTAETFSKTLRPGTVPDYTGRPMDVFCRIEWDGTRLSISGVEGPKPNGDARGSSGQIDGGYAHRNPADNDARTHNPVGPDEITFGPGWDAETWLDFLDVWARWHLNDMRAGCEHQRAAGRDKRPIDQSKPTTAYGRHFPGQRHDSWNLLGWVREDEHPEGLMCRACPECGYRYGTAWLSEDVPADVLDFLRGLPTADKQAAWV
jgi:hypothetical protein